MLDTAPYCGPGLVCQGVRVTALPHASGETIEVAVDGQRTTCDLWRIPVVCASCGTSFFKLELAHLPVRLQREADRRG